MGNESRGGRETVKLVNTSKGPVEVFPGIRCRVIGWKDGKALTQEFPIMLAEWHGLKASGATEEEAVRKVLERA